MNHTHITVCSYIRQQLKLITSALLEEKHTTVIKKEKTWHNNAYTPFMFIQKKTPIHINLVIKRVDGAK